MKIGKSQLVKMIKETVQEETISIASEQKKLAAYAKVCVHGTPYLYEHVGLKKKADLLEFFGPFKKLGVKDLEKMGKEKEGKSKEESRQKDIKALRDVAKEVESARKALSKAKLTDVAAIEQGLDNYVGKLHDLYELSQAVELDPKTKGELGKPFAAAAFTLQNLSQALSDAANKLFQAVPRGSGMYSAGQEAQDIESATSKFMKGPAERLADLWDLSAPGMGVGRGRPS